MSIFKTGLLLTLLGLGLAKGADAANSKTSDYSAPKSTSTYAVQKSTPNAQAKKSFLKNLEFEIGAGMEFGNSDPSKTYIEGADADWRNGKYTFNSVITDWKPIQMTVSNPTRLDASILYKINDKLKCGLNIGTSSSKGESSLHEAYTVPDTVYGTASLDISRSETFDANSTAIGIKGKYDINKILSAILSAKSEQLSITGKANQQLKSLDSSYIQSREINYSGSNSINSLEAGIEINPIKNVAVEISAGSRNGKVKTTGTSVRTQSTNNQVTTYEYSPEFDSNSAFGKVEVKIEF